MRRQTITGLTLLAVCCVLCSLLSHALSQVHRKGCLGDEVDGMKGDTIKLRSDDDGNRKRGVPCGHLARHISQECPFFKLSLLEPL